MDVMGAKSLVQQVLWQVCGSFAAEQIEPDAFWPRATLLEAEKNEMEAARSSCEMPKCCARIGPPKC